MPSQSQRPRSRPPLGETEAAPRRRRAGRSDGRRPSKILRSVVISTLLAASARSRSRSPIRRMCSLGRRYSPSRWRCAQARRCGRSNQHSTISPARLASAASQLRTIRSGLSTYASSLSDGSASFLSFPRILPRWWQQTARATSASISGRRSKGRTSSALSRTGRTC